MKRSILIFIILFLSINLISFSNQEQIDNYYKKGIIFLNNGDYINAIKLFEASLIKTNNNELKFKILFQLTKSYWNLGNIKKSYELALQTLLIAKKKNDPYKINLIQDVITIHNLYNEAKKFRSESKFSLSKEKFIKAINIAEKRNLIDFKIKCLRQLSITEFYDENYTKFYELNVSALNLAKKINHIKEQARCLNNIGLYNLKIDNYTEAINYFKNALTLFNQINDLKEISNCLNNIGIIYVYLGNYDKALEYASSALETDKKLNNLFSIISDFNQLGTIYRKKGLNENNFSYLEKSIFYYEEALKLIKKFQNDKLEIKLLNNIGTVYTDLNKNYKALEYFKKALTIAERTKDLEANGMILNNIGIVYYNLGNYEESSKYYQKAIQLALGIQRGQILWESYFELAKANWKQGNFYNSLENLKKAIDIIEKIRSHINLEEYRARFLGTDKRIEVYHNLINLLVFLHQGHPDQNYGAEAFHFLERAKARAFLDSLEISKVHFSKRINIKLQNREQELLKDISYLYTKLLTPSLSLEEKKRLQKELIDKEEELETLKREIRASDPAYAGLQYPDIINLNDAQKLLDKRTAFIAYCIDKNNGIGFYVTKNNLHIFSVPDRNKLQHLITNHLLEITDKSNLKFEFSKKLYSLLIPSFIEKNIKNLIIIPDDVLHRIPFETLINPSTNLWLVQKYNISYAPSVSSLRELIIRSRNNKKRPKDIIAIGDPHFYLIEKNKDYRNYGSFLNIFAGSGLNLSPLKYSNIELEKIKRIFTKKSDILSQTQAKEENIKNANLNDYKIIHFATHSLIDDKVPARSAIILSLDEDPNEDGFLQMREIYNLHLNADLVTLSACETGLGQFIRGEGIEGINRAFFYAGASAVLMSLWAVNDQATYQLMERFYYHLKNGVPLTDALRKAKLEMINSNVLDHPYYWAGFILSGKANQVIFPKNRLRWIIVSITCVLLGGVIAITIIKKNGHYKNHH